MVLRHFIGAPAELFLVHGLADLFDVEVVDHQFLAIDDFEATDQEIPTQTLGHTSRKVPAVAVPGHREHVLITLLVLAGGHRLVGVATAAADLQSQRFAPGVLAGPFAEQGLGRRRIGRHRFIEGHQTTAKQQKRQRQQQTSGFHRVLLE
ncbi:hypothetical protein D3C78_1382280 [compost metagenome]